MSVSLACPARYGLQLNRPWHGKWSQEEEKYRNMKKWRRKKGWLLSKWMCKYSLCPVSFFLAITHIQGPG
jgi:hypothetical protein